MSFFKRQSKHVEPADIPQQSENPEMPQEAKESKDAESKEADVKQIDPVKKEKQEKKEKKNKEKQEKKEKKDKEKEEKEKDKKDKKEKRKSKLGDLDIPAQSPSSAPTTETVETPGQEASDIAETPSSPSKSSSILKKLPSFKRKEKKTEEEDQKAEVQDPSPRKESSSVLRKFPSFSKKDKKKIDEQLKQEEQKDQNEQKEKVPSPRKDTSILKIPSFSKKDKKKIEEQLKKEQEEQEKQEQLETQRKALEQEQAHDEIQKQEHLLPPYSPFSSPPRAVSASAETAELHKDELILTQESIKSEPEHPKLDSEQQSSEKTPDATTTMVSDWAKKSQEISPRNESEGSTEYMVPAENLPKRGDATDAENANERPTGNTPAEAVAQESRTSLNAEQAENCNVAKSNDTTTWHLTWIPDVSFLDHREKPKKCYLACPLNNWQFEDPACELKVTGLFEYRGYDKTLPIFKLDVPNVPARVPYPYKLIVDGGWFVDGRYPTTTDESGNTNNIITLESL